MSTLASRCINDAEVVNAMQVTQRLLAEGHTNVVHVGGCRTDPRHRARSIGWHWAMSAAGLRPAEPLVTDGTAAGASLAGLEIARHYEVSAVVVADETLATAVAASLAGCGVDVPGDVVVVAPSGDEQ